MSVKCQSKSCICGLVVFYLDDVLRDDSRSTYEDLWRREVALFRLYIMSIFQVVDQAARFQSNEYWISQKTVPKNVHHLQFAPSNY